MLPEVSSTITFMATYSYLSTLRRRKWSVKFSIRSMQAPNPISFACSKFILLPNDIRISPGVDMDRKQHENNNNSHHELINKHI